MKVTKDSKIYKDFLNSIFYYIQVITTELIDFSFYISLFLECINSEYYIKILEIFNSEKLKELNEVKQEKIDIFKNILNNMENLLNYGEVKEINKEDLTII